MMSARPPVDYAADAVLRYCAGQISLNLTVVHVIIGNEYQHESACDDPIHAWHLASRCYAWWS